MPKEDPFVNRAQLLKAIKKYPEIWDSNNKLHLCRSVTSPMWNEIAEQFGGHVPTGECKRERERENVQAKFLAGAYNSRQFFALRALSVSLSLSLLPSLCCPLSDALSACVCL